VLVGPDWWDTVAPPAAPGPTLRALGGGFWVTELSQAGSRAAVVAHTDGWTAALPFSVSEYGTGVLTSPWAVADDGDPAGWRRLARVLLDAPGERVDVGPPTAPDVRVLVAYGEGDVGHDVRAFRDFAGALVADELLAGNRDLHIVTAGDGWACWRIGAPLPAPLDDLVAWCAAWSGPSTAVGTVRWRVFEDQRPPRPGVEVIAEHSRRRATARALVDFHLGPDHAATVRVVQRRDLPDPREPWLDRPVRDLPIAPLAFGLS
jgi:hypothetical protein